MAVLTPTQEVNREEQLVVNAVDIACLVPDAELVRGCSSCGAAASVKVGARGA